MEKRFPNETASSSTPTESKRLLNDEFIVPPHTQALKRTYSTPDTIPNFNLQDACTHQRQEKFNSRKSLVNSHHPCELCLSNKNQMTQIQRFRVKKDIGSGTFAHVKLVEDGSSGLLVLKILSKNLHESMNVFETETKILSQLHHKNIVELRECFQTDDLYCIALEYVQGRELFDIISKEFNSLTMTHIKDYFQQIVLGIQIHSWIFRNSKFILAVDYMHSLHIAHRDLKAENVLVKENGFVKLIDFGFAVQTSSESPNCHDHYGSSQYASPQIVMVQPYDPLKSDIWSLGVILFTLLTGELPFHTNPNGSVRKMIHRIARGEYKFPSPVSNFDEKAVSLTRSILITNPDKRPTASNILSHSWLANVD